MRLIIIPRLPQRYVFLAAGVFLTVAMLAGLLQPLTGMTELLPTRAQPVLHGDKSLPRIAFACNVFWGEEFLPDMLQTLEQENATITFFIGGSWAKRFPEVLRLLADKGHELGNHSWSHPHPNSLSKAQNMEQIRRTEQFVKDTVNCQTRLYAPPYGEYNDTVLAAAAELGYKTILWSVDTIDWQRPPVELLKQRVLRKVHNGAIILIHPTAPTAQAMPSLIRELKEQGYTITTVSDIIN